MRREGVAESVASIAFRVELRVSSWPLRYAKNSILNNVRIVYYTF